MESGDGSVWLGWAAGFLSSLSYIPQVRKAWHRKSTDDLSLAMLLVLTSGLCLWVIYGWLRKDWAILAANTFGASLTGIVLVCKLRDMRAGRG